MRGRSMFSRVQARSVVASLLVFVGLTLGCEERSPSGPTPQPPPTALSVTAISPSTGSTDGAALVTIRGTGFLAGATVALGATATSISVVNNTTITATAPAHDAGTVDVVVTNPGGQSGRLSGAFTYTVDQPYTVTPSANTVAAGGQLGVSWTAPRAGVWDWVGLFRVGDPSTAYESGWWKYTNGVISGTLTLNAPMQPGQYQFRYLLDDGFVDTARSSPVAVR